MPNAEPCLPLPWYTRDDWERLALFVSDCSDFRATFDDWLRWAEDTVARLQQVGFKAEKMRINAGRFLLWCAEKGVPANGVSLWRFTFGSYNAAEHDQ